MKTTFKTWLPTLLLAIAAVGFTACDGTGNSTGETPDEPIEQPQDTVKTEPQKTALEQAIQKNMALLFEQQPKQLGDMCFFYDNNGFLVKILSATDPTQGFIFDYSDIQKGGNKVTITLEGTETIYVTLNEVGLATSARVNYTDEEGSTSSQDLKFKYGGSTGSFYLSDLLTIDIKSGDNILTIDAFGDQVLGDEYGNHNGYTRFEQSLNGTDIGSTYVSYGRNPETNKGKIVAFNYLYELPIEFDFLYYAGFLGYRTASYTLPIGVEYNNGYGSESRSFAWALNGDDLPIQVNIKNEEGETLSVVPIRW